MSEHHINHIMPYPNNPMYWQYNGRPVLLLGGSKTDHLFLLDDLEAHLDEAHLAGVNYLRNTMSQRERKELKPHKLLSDGRFDLDLWNDEYWDRFRKMLELTFQREIIVQIEVWDRFDFSRDFWTHSPWNPGNNVNYSNEESGLAAEYPEHPGADLQPFFHTVPGMKRYEKRLDGIRRRQEEFVRKMLSCSLRYPHVLYCMDNETSTAPEWGRFWIDFIRAEARTQSVEVQLTDMFDDVHNPEESRGLNAVLADSAEYDFVEVSQINSRNFGEDHWQKVQWILDRVRTNPRPVNNVKIYSDGYKPFGTGGPHDGVERLMRDILGGCAAGRFHRDGSGIGLNHVAKSVIAAVRKLESIVKLWDIKPAMNLFVERSYNQAYAAAKSGEFYVVYFTFGGVVGFDLSNTSGVYRLRWIDVSAGTWGPEGVITAGKAVRLEAPDAGGWIATLTNTSTERSG